MALNGIKNIKIENIKGIIDLDLSFDELLLVNKLNILVANNGFGKTSFARAMGYLNEAKLELKNDDINEYAKGFPLVEMEYVINDKWYNKIADQKKNNIKDDL